MLLLLCLSITIFSLSNPLKLTSLIIDPLQGPNQNPLDPAHWISTPRIDKLQILNNECVTTVLDQADGTMWNTQVLTADCFVEVQVNRIRKFGALFIYLATVNAGNTDLTKVYDSAFFTSDGVNYFFQVEQITLPGTIVWRGPNIPFIFKNADKLAVAVVGK